MKLYTCGTYDDDGGGGDGGDDVATRELPVRLSNGSSVDWRLFLVIDVCACVCMSRESLCDFVKLDKVPNIYPPMNVKMKSSVEAFPPPFVCWACMRFKRIFLVILYFNENVKVKLKIREL